MIARIRGRVVVRGVDSVVVEVAGVGIRVVVAPRTSADLREGEDCALVTELVVREDSLTLYGFADADERDVFLALQTVSGIGPRLALTALATLSAEQIRAAVSGEDIAVLTSVPGLGRKSAQRIILDLRDKLVTTGVTAIPGDHAWQEQVAAALTGLGWASADAAAALGAVAARPDASDLPVAEALRLALQALDRSEAVGR